MKKKTILLASCLCAARLLMADAADTLETAREAAFKGMDEYNSATECVNSDFAIIGGMRASFSSCRASAESIGRNSSELAVKADILRERIDVFEISFNGDLKSAHFIFTNVLETLKKFPLAQERIKKVEAAIEKGAELTAKNPGDKYQDKNYFEGCAMRFRYARDMLEASQNSLRRLGILVSTNVPKIDGARKTCDMAREYAVKTDETVAQNSDEMRKISVDIDSFSKVYAASAKKYAELFDASRAARSAVEWSFAEVSSFVLNEFSVSEKYSSYKSRSRKTVYLESPDPLSEMYLSRGGIEMKESVLGVSAANFDEVSRGGYASKQKSEGIVKVERQAKADDVRAEILDICREIDIATFQIQEACAVLSAVFQTAQKANARIDASVAESSEILRGAIDAFTQAQRIASDIRILSVSVETAKEQNKNSLAEFERLFADASAKYKAVEESAKFAKAKVDAAREELKK